MTRRLLRTQSSVSVGATSTVLAGPNLRRIALVVSAPVPNVSGQLQEDQLVHAVSTAATGVLASYTVPAGVQAYLQSATWVNNAGTPPTLALQVIRAATTFTLQSGAASVALSFNFPLKAGDVVQWNCTVAGAGSNVDASLGIVQDQSSNRVTVSFIEPAVLDNGVNMYPGNAPFSMLDDHFGQGIREGISAIAATAGQTVSVLDIFEEDCDCNPDTLARVSAPPPPKTRPFSYGNTR